MKFMCCHKMHGISTSIGELQEKLKLSGSLESEQFVELFGSNEKKKKQWKAVGRFVVAVLNRRKELLTRI